MRGLAVTGAQRSALAPEIPTASEAGLPGFRLEVWFGLMAPARTPNAVIEKLHGTVVAAAQTPDVIQSLQAQGVEPASNTPGEFATFIADTLDRYRKVAEKDNLKFE